MTTEDQIRRILHPGAHEPMPYNPRLGVGWDQQGRHPQAAEPCVDLDELGVRLPEPDPRWENWLLVAVALLVLVLVFVPLGA
jgi:hypothetical protein